jgi:Tol biopolymer transport system component
MKRTAILIAALVVLLPSAAHAAFPGRNGALVYGWSYGDSQTMENGIWTTSPGTRARGVLSGCTDVDSDLSPCATVNYGDPSVSPDGERVVFDTGPQLATVSFDGSDLLMLPQRSRDDGSPAFAPNGRRIVFDSGEPRYGSARDLWIADADGAHAQRLTSGSSPAWSTRGWIAFGSHGHLYRIRPDGTGRRRLTRGTGALPTWSPDGRRLAFVSHGVWVARADSTQPRHIVSGAIVDGVAWSPDGRRLAAMGYFEGMWTMDLRGRRLREFEGGSSDSAETSYYTRGIDWQPLP